MNKTQLAQWQTELLERLSNGQRPPDSGDEALQRYVSGFDPDAYALAVVLWRKWGVRADAPSEPSESAAVR